MFVTPLRPSQPCDWTPPKIRFRSLVFNSCGPVGVGSGRKNHQKFKNDCKAVVSVSTAREQSGCACQSVDMVQGADSYPKSVSTCIRPLLPAALCLGQGQTGPRVRPHRYARSKPGATVGLRCRTSSLQRFPLHPGPQSQTPHRYSSAGVTHSPIHPRWHRRWRDPGPATRVACRRK